MKKNILKNTLRESVKMGIQKTLSSLPTKPTGILPPGISESQFQGNFTPPPPPEKRCKFNSLKHFKHKKAFLLNNKGFSITGVVVASTIGVIAMTGMAKHMALIAQQQQKINKERELNAFWEQFGTETNCKETIKGWLNQNTPPANSKKEKLALGTEGNEIEIKVLKKKKNNVVSNFFDVSTANNVFRRHGFTPRFFVLRCNPADNGGSCDCKASGTTYPCKKTWMLIPGVQRGMTFIRGRVLNLDIEWSSAPNSTYTNFDCTKIGISGGKNRCYKAEATGSKRTLAGCGSTQSLGGTGTTAFGNDVARSATITGAENYFFGHWAGHSAKVSSTGNSFFGDRAGLGVEIKARGTNNGNANVFVGQRAGDNATIDGGTQNHFFGFQSGYDATVRGHRNHFLGPYSGYKVNMTSGNNNTFVGSNAGRETTISAGGNHFFGDNAGKKATVSGGQNHFIGDHAGQSATVAGARNTFLGNSAGWNADVRSGADGNVFIGQSAGKKDHGTTTGGYISGDLNVFLGHAAGRTAKVSGHYNTFIGAGAGDGQPISGNGGTYIKGSKIEIKANDVVIKSGAGGVKCAWNEYLRGFDGNGKLCGVRATIGTCPSGQVLSGFNADGTLNCVATGGTGWKQTCPVGDVLRGFNSAGNKVCALQDKCNAGYYWSGSRCITRCGSSQRWNHERATCVAYTPPPSPQQGCSPGCSADSICRSGTCVPLSPGGHGSSKVYKKNIRPFNDMEKALKDILETPLFTYYFKDKNNFPKKKRMGVIAEDLPKNLQLKGKPIAPDWPSIYGTLWAGIKALHSKIESFKKDVLSKFKTLNSTIEAKFKALSKTDDQFKKELAGTNKELANTKQELKSANEKIDSLSKELKELKSSFEKKGLNKIDNQPIR